VNEQIPYERSLAAKLEQLPVPDMADRIWVDIEMQLDTAGDVPNAPSRPPASGFKRIGWYGLAGLAAAVVLLWWHFSHNRPRKTMPPKVLPEMHAPLPVRPSVPQVVPPAVTPPVYDSPASGKPAPKRTIPLPTSGIEKDTASLLSVPKDSVFLDSTARLLLPSMKPDTSSLSRNRPGLPDVDLYGPSPSRPHGKKPGGVKGIGEDDYKITASKDSGRKKN